MVPTIGHLQRLASCGVAFHSYTEPMLSTDNELVRDIVFAVMASLAKVERQKISDRTKAGLERAKAKGKRLGRAPFSVLNRDKLRMVLDTGKTWHAASVATDIPYSTVKKHARALGYSPPKRRGASAG
jgi:DNA invertase Pin-like site-specific DNA recombinase